MQRSTTHQGTTYRGARPKADSATWAGNGLAILIAAVGIGLGVIGMLVGFGISDEPEGEAFRDGIAWMVPGLILTIVANLFRREHHIVNPDADNKTMTGDMLASNGVGLIMAVLAVVAAIIGMFVNFEVLNDGNANAFEDGLIWFTGAAILAFASLVYRREAHVPDTHGTNVETKTVERDVEPGARRV